TVMSAINYKIQIVKYGADIIIYAFIALVAGSATFISDLTFSLPQLQLAYETYEALEIPSWVEAFIFVGSASLVIISSLLMRTSFQSWKLQKDFN
ncbi:hypothetical protein NMZ99_004657, partial [Vibrio parahaemolyticus]|nr:hypothetical protein [Vibrio parahaemolyticus]